MDFEADSFQESEAVRRLMKLMSDRPRRSPSSVLSKKDSDRYKIQGGTAIQQQLGLRNGASSDSDHVLMRAERMRREVENTLDSMRRQRSEIQKDVNSKNISLSVAQHPHNSRSYSYSPEKEHNSDESRERNRSGTHFSRVSSAKDLESKIMYHEDSQNLFNQHVRSGRGPGPNAYGAHQVVILAFKSQIIL